MKKFYSKLTCQVHSQETRGCYMFRICVEPFRSSVETGTKIHVI